MLPRQSLLSAGVGAGANHAYSVHEVGIDRHKLEAIDNCQNDPSPNKFIRHNDLLYCLGVHLHEIDGTVNVAEIPNVDWDNSRTGLENKVSAHTGENLIYNDAGIAFMAGIVGRVGLGAVRKLRGVPPTKNGLFSFV